MEPVAGEESELQYRELVQFAPIVVWRYNIPQRCFNFVNGEAETLLGFPAANWMDQPDFFNKQVHALDKPSVAKQWASAMAGESRGPFEHRLITSSGAVIWVRTEIRLLRGSNELAGLQLDISQRKQHEEALEQQRRLFNALMEASPECIYFKDLNSRFVKVNRAVAEMFGLASPGEALGKSDADFFTGSHVAKALLDEQRIIRTGEPLIDCEEQETWPDGRVTWASTTKMPLRDARDEICGTIGVSRNITERKQAQRNLQERTKQLIKTNAELERQMEERRLLEGQLVQSQKLESIGQLAAGVAHEMNTPIQYVGDNCRFFSDSFQQIDRVLRQYSRLLQQVKENGIAAATVSEIEATLAEVELDYLLEEIPKAIEQSNEGIDRVAHIVRAMKEFSHPGSARMEAVDLNHAIKSTLTVSRNEWKYVAEAVTHLDRTLPPVRCLAGEINQMLLNLVVNAAHAIADAKRASAGEIAVTTRLHGEMVEIRIRDNGTGIPAAIQSRVFDPFFTTKEVGRGSGQGLAMARNVIVKKHGGTITFETALGQGTEFTVRLPVAGVA